jgi:hypothetical protein
MTWLFALAGFMAIFGILGYLRGTKAALFVLITTLFAVAVTGILGDSIIKYMNALWKGFQFILSGGLGALSGEGGGADALASLQNTPPLVTPQNQNLVLGLLFVGIVFLGVLLSGIKWFKGPHSVWGLLLGLIAGYIVAAMVVRAIAPEYAALVPLPFGFGPATPETPVVIVPGQSTGPSFAERILAFLNSLVDRGLIAVFLGAVIAIFLLLAVRSGNRNSARSERKG